MPRASLSTPKPFEQAGDRVGEAHGEEDGFCRNFLFGARDFSHLHLAGLLVLLPLDFCGDQRLQLAVLSAEFLGGDGPGAVAAFIVRGGGAQLERASTATPSPCFPSRADGASVRTAGCSWRPWRLEVPTQSEPVSPPPITTTFLPVTLIWSFSLSPAFALFWRNQEFQRVVNAFQLTARNRQITRHFGAGGDQHSIEILHQLLWG